MIIFEFSIMTSDLTVILKEISKFNTQYFLRREITIEANK